MSLIIKSDCALKRKLVIGRHKRLEFRIPSIVNAMQGNPKKSLERGISIRVCCVWEDEFAPGKEKAGMGKCHPPDVGNRKRFQVECL